MAITKYNVGEVVRLPFEILSIQITPRKIEYTIRFTCDLDNRKFYVEESSLISLVNYVKDKDFECYENTEDTESEYDPTEEVYNLAEKIGIHNLYARVVELRGEPLEDNITEASILECKPEFLSEKVVRESADETMHDRWYAKGWNDCNNTWIAHIKEMLLSKNK